jgi:hypothetical protein
MSDVSFDAPYSESALKVTSKVIKLIIESSFIVSINKFPLVD